MRGALTLRALSKPFPNPAGQTYHCHYLTLPYKHENTKKNIPFPLFENKIKIMGKGKGVLQVQVKHRILHKKI